MAVRELAERSIGGIVVQLFWDDSAPPGSEVIVEYRDESQQVFYTLYPHAECALEAFYHPNAYADSAVHASSQPRAAA